MGKPFKEQSAGAITNFSPPQVIFLMSSWELDMEQEKVHENGVVSQITLVQSFSPNPQILPWKFLDRELIERILQWIPYARHLDIVKLTFYCIALAHMHLLLH